MMSKVLSDGMQHLKQANVVGLGNCQSISFHYYPVSGTFIWQRTRLDDAAVSKYYDYIVKWCSGIIVYHVFGLHCWILPKF